MERGRAEKEEGEGRGEGRIERRGEGEGSGRGEGDGRWAGERGLRERGVLMEIESRDHSLLYMFTVIPSYAYAYAYATYIPPSLLQCHSSLIMSTS